MKLLLFGVLLAVAAYCGPDIILQSGHGANISALAFSPDGKFLATASEDNTVRLWDPQAGSEIRTLRGHSNIVTSLAINGDGSRIATASLDHTLRVWNSATGEQLSSFRGPDPATYLLKFTPDSTTLVTAETVAAGTILRMWDIHSGKQIRSIKREDAAVSHVFFSGLRMMIAEESGEDEATGVLTTYLLTTGKQIESHSELLCGASDDGRWIAIDHSTESGRKATVLNVAANKSVSAVKGQVSRVVFSSTGEWLAYETASGSEAVVQATSGGSSHTVRGRGAEFSMIALSPDGQWLATAGADFSVHIWDVAHGKLARAMAGQYTPSVVAFTSDGKYVAANGGGTDVGNAAQVWDIERRAMIAAPRIKRNITGMAFSRDASSIAVSSPSLEIFDRRANSSDRRFNCANGTASSLLFSPNGKWIAANCAGIATVWSVSSGSEAAHVGEPIDGLPGPLAFSLDSELLAVASANGVLVYDVAARKTVMHVTTHDPVSAVAFGAGNELAFGTHLSASPLPADYSSLYLIDTHTHKKLWSSAMGPWVSSLKFAHEGRELMIVSGSLQLIDAANGHLIKTLIAKVPNPASAAFSDNNEWFGVGANSATWLWRLSLSQAPQVRHEREP